MARRGLPGLASGDGASLSKGHKRLGMVPTKRQVAQLVGGDPVQRTIGNFAKMAPTYGPNINGMAGPPITVE